MIKFNCACGRRYSAPDEKAGRSITCRACGAAVEIPEAGFVEPRPAAPDVSAPVGPQRAATSSLEPPAAVPPPPPDLPPKRHPRSGASADRGAKDPAKVERPEETRSTSSMPGGVALFFVLWGLFVAASAGGGAYLMTLTGREAVEALRTSGAELPPSLDRDMVQSVLQLQAMKMFGAAVIWLVLGVGLWFRSGTAYWITLALMALAVLGGAIQIQSLAASAAGGSAETQLYVIAGTLLVLAFEILLLLSSSTRAWFRGSRRS